MILKTLKENLMSNRKKLNDSLLSIFPYVSVPLETGISVPEFKKNCTPAGKVNLCIKC